MSRPIPRDQLLKNDPDTTQSLIDTTYTITVISVIVGPLIGVGLWLWMAWKNGQGRPWARIVATVLGGINVLATLLSLTAATGLAVTIVINLVTLVLAAVILILLWRPESTRFYRATSAPLT